MNNNHCERYMLVHDTPEISRGAIVEANCGDKRFVVTNLEDVARYPLVPSSRFTFHRYVVENKSYWFEKLD